MSASPIIVWFRRDLRLSDQPALAAAIRAGRPVVPLYIWAPEEEAPWPPGAASRWWLHHSLADLASALEQKNSRLIVRVGPSETALLEVLRETGAGEIFWNRLYEPAPAARDARIERVTKAAGAMVRRFNSALLFEPWEARTQAGAPFRVFTPFWRHCLSREEPAEPLPAPPAIPAPAAWPRTTPLAELHLLPRIAWDSGLRAAWTPGETGARRALDGFVDGALARYPEDRDRPGCVGTSRLSPHLHFGEISPREIWHAVREAEAANAVPGMVKGAETFLRELGWREFGHHLLHHFPRTPEEPLNERFAGFPWRKDPAGGRAWQKGMTGYPIVDAGLRELWQTGWMHNRVRMIAASFLVKDLLLPWLDGARWFWDTLVDADLANNTLGWQWTAGCGADAAPYFRVFNPVLQGAKFDPDGAYVRRWIPELKAVPNAFVHQPWLAPQPPAGYPPPILDHAAARDRALAALATISAGDGA